MALTAIRNELVKFHRLIKTPETPCEDLVQKGLATLHDNIAQAESSLVVLNVATLKALVDGQMYPLKGEVKKEVDNAIEYAERRAREQGPRQAPPAVEPPPTPPAPDAVPAEVAAEQALTPTPAT